MPPREDETSIRIRIFNTTAVSLLNEAITGLLGRTQKISVGLPMPIELPAPFLPSRIRLDAADSASINDYKNSENLHCYELILPKQRKHDLYKVMRFEIEHFFGLTATVDTLETKAYALVKIGSGPKPSEGKPRPPEKPLTFLHWNASATTLAQSLEQRLAIPVVDETGMTTPFDIYWDDLERKGLDAVQIELRKHGLELREVQRNVELLVIRDKR